MKYSVIAAAAFALGVSAQAPPNLPQCGATTCMLPAISSSGCGFTDSACLCGKPAFKSALTTCVPSKCTSQSDIQSFYTFVNGQCSSQPGWPIKAGGDSPPAADTASSGSSSSSGASSGTGTKPASPSGAGGAAPHAAVSSAAVAKPAQYSGAGSSSFTFSAGVLAFAGLAHLF